MKKTVGNFMSHTLVRHYLFWLLFFFVMRFLFVVVNFRFLQGGFFHKTGAFVYALRLDLATASFAVVLPLFCWLIYLLINKPFILRCSRWFNYLLIILFVFICLMNIGNYANWGTVINKRVLLYFKNPAEVTHFMSTWQLILSPLIILGMILLWIWIFKRIVPLTVKVPERKITAALNILYIPILVLFMRGGVQTVPINESVAYYSSYNSNCHASVNPVYYFMHDVSDYYYVSNKFNFISNEEAINFHKKLMLEIPNDTLTLSTHKQPNIVFILLESWTADIIEELDVDTGVTPYTKTLIEESLFFTRCYGSGYRTDQGLVCVLSGYPSQPDNSIIAYPAKSGSLPSLCKFLMGKNYSSSFFYGGDIGFANMRSYIVQQGFEYICDQANFPAKDQNSKWGAHDGKVFDAQIKYLNEVKQPFISGLLTLSTHEPFEVPVKHKFPHSSDPDKFRNSAYYTDQCLKNYFNEVKKTSWYKNTIFVLVADHGHHLPKERNMDSPESKRITCLITGGALTPSLKGVRWRIVMNQHDLIIPIAELLKMPLNEFKFSKNPLTTKHPFAYYSNENVLGFVTDSARYTYDFKTKKENGLTDLGPYAKAYLQVLYGDFISR